MHIGCKTPAAANHLDRHLHQGLDFPHQHLIKEPTLYGLSGLPNNTGFSARIIKHSSPHRVNQTTATDWENRFARKLNCGLTEAKACPGSAAATSSSTAPRGALGAPASLAQARPTAASAAGWSSAVTEGRTGASPQPTAPLESSTRTATLETDSRREDAMVKGAASGTSSGRASAADTSTEKVSLRASKPKVSIGGVGDGDGEMARRRVTAGSWRPPPRAGATRGPGLTVDLGLVEFRESRRSGEEEEEETEVSMVTDTGEWGTRWRMRRFVGMPAGGGRRELLLCSSI